jgi:hypothetical protein
MTEEKKEANQKIPDERSNQTDSEDQARMVPDASFLQLSFLLGAQAMQSLGIIPNPMTNKTETDLVLAKFNIDLLEMLKTKTKGNRTPEEDKGLEELLFNLRMAYVEIGKKQGSQKS